jgi:CDP-glucose 4,6-dehydratase
LVGHIRPWQHVLEPLYGYLLLAEKMHKSQPVAESYNFGPPHSATTTVLDVAEIARSEWPSTLEFAYPSSNMKIKESDTLRLNSTNSLRDLGWNGILSVEEAVKFTLDWEKAVLTHSPLEVTRSQIDNYLERQS